MWCSSFFCFCMLPWTQYMLCVFVVASPLIIKFLSTCCFCCYCWAKRGNPLIHWQKEGQCKRMQKHNRATTTTTQKTPRCTWINFNLVSSFCCFWCYCYPYTHTYKHIHTYVHNLIHSWLISCQPQTIP